MIWPDIHDERMMELRGRGIAARPAMPWRTNGVALATVFFLLTCAAMTAMWGFVHITLDREKFAFWFTAIASIALAEYLIRAHHFFGTGVESALWLGGLFCVIFGLPGEGKPEALLLFALAAAIAGWRVRNPLFGGLAASFVISYATARHFPWIATAIGILFSLMALAALSREWRRPSTEMLWVVLSIIPPIVSAIAAAGDLSPVGALAYALLATISLVAGLRYRHHAMLIGAGVSFSIATGILAAHDLLPLRNEWRLIVGGAALLAIAAAVARALRGRSRGLVVSKEALTKFDEELQIFGTLALQPRFESVGEPQGGGRFGGAGATGDY